MPRTQRGAAALYAPPPWHLSGRALALRFRLRDPDEARRHLPSWFAVDDDPVLGARFWELTHDAGFGDDRATMAAGATTFREAVVAMPVGFGTHSGDNTVHLYADDPVYTAFAREVMGWPVLPGRVSVSAPWPSASLESGTRVAGSLERHGHTLMAASLTLTARLPADRAPSGKPTWLTEKLIPGVDGGTAVHQVVRTGPTAVRWGAVWEAEGSLSFGASTTDELQYLEPREIISAQLWSDIELWLGPGEVLAKIEPPAPAR